MVLRAPRISSLLLVIIFILSDCYNIQTMVVQSASSHDIEVGSTENFDFLLRELVGAHLRLSFFVEPPWSTLQRDSNGTVTYKGYIAEIADYIAKALKITYSFVLVDNEEIKKHGPLKANINLVSTNETDFVSRLMDVMVCSKVMECSLPLLFQGFRLLVPWPKEETRILSPIRPFQLKVWIFLPISIISVALALILLQKYYKRKSNIGNSHHTIISSIHKAIVYLVAGEGDLTGFNQFSFRLVQGAWCLAAIVLFNAYCSTLISYLISPRMMPIAKSYEELVAGSPQKLKFLSEKNEIFAVICLEATSGPLKGIGDLLRKYPESQFTDRNKGYELMFTGQYAYAAVALRIARLMETAFLKSGKCNFVVSNERIVRTSTLVWGFPKNWRYTNAVNHRLRGLAESGLVNYWINRITPKNKICKVENRKAFSPADDQRKILSLYDLSGPFILLITGSMLSLFVFLVEKIYYYYKLIANLSFPPPMEVRAIIPRVEETDCNMEKTDQLSTGDDKHGSYLEGTTTKVENVLPATGVVDF